MPNYCFYEMKVKGSSQSINQFIDILQYNHPDECFYRVFEAEVYDESINGNNSSAYVSGYVAWSILCTMISYPDIADAGNGKHFVSIKDVSEQLNLEIEIFSSESGIGFQEHYIISKGDMLVDDCEDYTEYYFDESEYEGESIHEKIFQFIEDHKLNISVNDIVGNDTYAVGGIENYGEWNI